MQKSSLMLSSALLALAMTISIPALAQDIDFGDDSSRWANDGQCDDPRFEGPGAATIRSPSDMGHDATDCRTAYEAGEVTLVAGPAASNEAPASSSANTGEIDFGDDSGSFANDGECDDPRFGGSLSSHRLRDATDCSTAYEAGEVTYSGGQAAQSVPADEIDFGDDSGSWANDGECDDPRFGGSLESHRLKDATDCRSAYEGGEVTYLGGGATDALPAGEIDFGDDSGSWANDGECDDPRFGGSLDNHRLKDATDCRAAYEAGEVTYLGVNASLTTTPPISMTDVDYGDDSGSWAEDEECDDPRFVGPGTGAGLSDHERADASDCRAAVEAGRAILPQAIDFGDDSGNWANDNECDDPRFYGPASGYPDSSHIRADATDCRTAFEQGEVDYLGEDGLVVDGVNYGNDSGTYANDNECDDARFSGSGMGASLRSHIMADATDCRAAMEAGTIVLGESQDETPSSDFRINFGDDSGDYPNDGECDDPRFQGRGAAMELYDRNILRDATDCRAAYDEGTVTYQP